MARFRTPLIATAIIFVAMVVIGIASLGLIGNSSGSNRQKAERASLVGAGVATLGCVAMAPFWLYAASRIGRERRRNRF